MEDLNHKSEDNVSLDIWDIKNCPKIDCASRNKLTNNFHAREDIDKTLDKLNELISDRVTQRSKAWISRLLDVFLRDIENDGYCAQWIEQLPTVMRLIEFIGQRVKDDEDYREYFNRMLKLCALPPTLRKGSESIRAAAVLERYFTMLGYLMMTLTMDREILIICEALERLLLTNKSTNVVIVKIEIRRAAMEKSQLPIIVTQLANICSPNVYLRVLELAYLMLTISRSCPYRMLKAGMLDNVLTRMDPIDRKVDDTLPNDYNAEIYKEEIIVATNILWELMLPILPPNKFAENLKNLPGPPPCAMRSLRNAFRKQVCESQASDKSLTLRNDLAVLILAGLMALPSWRLVRYGLAEDLITLAVATESVIPKDTWIENIKFGTSNEDLHFKKIMLSILCQLSNRGPAIAIMIKRKVIPAILELVNPEIGDKKIFWSTAQFWYMHQFAMLTLARLVPKMSREFILHNGPLRLRMLVEWSLTVGFNSQMILEIVKTICSIVTHKCSNLLEKFREEDITSSFIELVNRIVAFDCLTTQHQRILTLVMIIIQDLTKTNERFDHKNNDGNLQMIMELLQRCIHRKKDDFQLDQRLLITIGSYIWKCILRSPETLKKFVDNGGIYLILDVSEKAILPVRCVYFGILTDICSTGNGAPHLCTWRGVDKTKGFMALLAKSWREEEIRLGVKRNADGCIEDVELPIMGTEQWIQAFHARPTHDASPALASMIGSARPKIYSIKKIMTNESDRFEKSKEHYRILLNDMTVEDQITMHIADHLYRFAQGQIWSEVSRYLEQVGVHLLGMDGEITFLMNQRHRGWGIYVRELQDKVLKAKWKKETINELEELARIKNSKLGSSLRALEEMDYIRRTTDREYVKNKSRSARVTANIVRSLVSLNVEKFHGDFANEYDATVILERERTCELRFSSFSAKHRRPIKKTKVSNVKKN